MYYFWEWSRYAAFQKKKKKTEENRTVNIFDVVVEIQMRQCDANNYYMNSIDWPTQPFPDEMLKCMPNWFHLKFYSLFVLCFISNWLFLFYSLCTLRSRLICFFFSFGFVLSFQMTFICFFLFPSHLRFKTFLYFIWCSQCPATITRPFVLQHIFVLILWTLFDFLIEIEIV